MNKIFLCSLYIIAAVLGLSFMRYGATHIKETDVIIPIIDLHLSKWSIIGILFYGMSFLLYLGVISKFNLSYIIPLVGGISNVLILLVSFLFLKEKMTLNSVVGALIVIVGVVIMNIQTQ